MPLADLQKEITATFPNAEVTRIFFMKQNIRLEEEYGFIPENTHFAEGGCSDEINEYEYLMMEQYWGERFKFGGLAGYCHAGKTGLEAVSNHVPEIAGKKNLLFLTGAHIGFQDGIWGKLKRQGQPKATSACGSLASVLQTDFEQILNSQINLLDQQQQMVERIMIPYIKECLDNGETPDLLDATRHMMNRIDTDLLTMITDLITRFDGQVAMVTGITINTALGNFFSPSTVKVLQR